MTTPIHSAKFLRPLHTHPGRAWPSAPCRRAANHGTVHRGFLSNLATVVSGIDCNTYHYRLYRSRLCGSVFVLHPFQILQYLRTATLFSDRIPIFAPLNTQQFATFWRTISDIGDSSTRRPPLFACISYISCCAKSKNECGVMPRTVPQKCTRLLLASS